MSTVSQATDAIYNRLHSTSQTPLYHPSSADLFTDWNYEAGDVISIKSDNTSYKTPLYKTQLKWTGAPKMTVTASGNKERDQIVEMKRREYASSTSNYSNQKALRGGMGAAQSGVKEIDGRLYQAGLSIDPVTGLFMYQTIQGDGFALGASLKIQDGKINAKADSTVVDALSTRVGNAEIAIDGANAQIALKASQTTVDALGTRVSQAEIDIDGAEAAIALKVSKGDISTQLAVECGNVSISGGNLLVVDGYVEADQILATGSAAAAYIKASNLLLTSGNININSVSYSPHTISMGSGASIRAVKALAEKDYDFSHYHAITATESDGKITLTLGAVQSSEGTANFKIADTKAYKDGVSAVTLKNLSPSDGTYYPDYGVYTNITVNLTNGKTASQYTYVPVTKKKKKTVTAYYPSSFEVTNVVKTSRGYTVYADIKVKVEYSDGTSDTSGAYSRSASYYD